MGSWELVAKVAKLIVRCCTPFVLNYFSTHIALHIHVDTFLFFLHSFIYYVF
jgi:hypothetical protein